MKKEITTLNLSSYIDKAKKQYENNFFIASVTDKKGNTVKVWTYEKFATDNYPFTDDHISIIHNPLFFTFFTLDIENSEIQPTDFIEIFGIGYKKGLTFLEEEGIFLKDIADVNKRKSLFDVLKRILHERNFNGHTLLKKVYDTFPLLWNEKSIKAFGEYHGIITAIDRIAERAGINSEDLQKDKEKQTLEFKDLFEDESGYNTVIKALSESGYINPESMVWIDEGKGYKSFASSLIKFVHSKGYFKIKPTNEEIQMICKATFKIDVGIDTIKRSNPENFGFYKLQI